MRADSAAKTDWCIPTPGKIIQSIRGILFG